MIFLSLVPTPFEVEPRRARFDKSNPVFADFLVYDGIQEKNKTCCVESNYFKPLNNRSLLDGDVRWNHPKKFIKLVIDLVEFHQNLYLSPCHIGG